VICDRGQSARYAPSEGDTPRADTPLGQGDTPGKARHLAEGDTRLRKLVSVINGPDFGSIPEGRRLDGTPDKKGRTRRADTASLTRTRAHA